MRVWGATTEGVGQTEQEEAAEAPEIPNSYSSNLEFWALTNRTLDLIPGLQTVESKAGRGRRPRRAVRIASQILPHSLNPGDLNLDP